MRRLPDAPNPTMDLLIAESLAEFAAAGVEMASLGSVPLSHGRVAERVYPTRSLRRFKDKFAPQWKPEYLATSSRFAAPAAMLAVVRAYSRRGLLTALRRNA
jgi:phosphatidylglycerol lysyltransferase